MSVETTDYSLGELMNRIGSGEIQLPNFQRNWKWEDERIIALLASILSGHPIGVLMFLEVGEEKPTFAATPLEGAQIDNNSRLEYLLLDGQQRLTSLFQSLYSDKPVKTTDDRKKSISRWYYIDIGKALINLPNSEESVDIEEAVYSVPEDRLPKGFYPGSSTPDLSTRKKECEAEMFPLSGSIDPDKTNAWMVEFVKRDKAKVIDNLERWNEFEKNFVSSIKNYRIPVIILKKDTPKIAVCKVFERVNTGGVALNVFELLTATFAAEDFSLKDDWDKKQRRLDKHRALNSILNSDFLQVVALLTTYQRKMNWSGKSKGRPGISCKRKEILQLSVEEYQEHAERATEGFIWAASFLSKQGIFDSKDLPYRTQLVPLAALRATLGPRIDNIGTFSLIGQWYWCGVFGELYRGAIETLYSRDLEQVVGWVNNWNTQPDTIGAANFSSSRLLTLRTRTSAAYKGLQALLIRTGGLDWQRNQKINEAVLFDYSIDIHHIFPKKWCKANGIERDRYESIVNKTAISSATNRKIGGKAPSVYLPVLQKEAGISGTQLDNILDTHAIDSKSLREDDFGKFFSFRRKRLLDIIEKAMGKTVNRDDENTEGILRYRQNYLPTEG